jgi:hypothetical protein
MFNKKKIIIRIKGGLGNQLFQYCLGEIIYSKLKIIVNYDIKTGYLNDAFNRNNCFHFVFKQNEDLIYKGFFNNIYLLRILKVLSLKFKISFMKHFYLQENKNVYINNIFDFLNKTRNNIILEGYWQNLELINYEFIEKLNLGLEKPFTIYSKNDLIIHYRSDNFSDSLSFDYFEHAIKHILKNYPNIDKIIIYSDSKKVLNLLDFLKERNTINILVDYGDYEPILLLSTLARSNYFIPSNGTFSLWTSLLGTNRVILLPPSIQLNKISYIKNIYLTSEE